MTSINLNRTEANARASLISDVHYSVNLDLTTGSDLENSHYRSTTKVTFSSGSGSTFIDFRAPQVDRVTLDGEDITSAAVPTVEGKYDATSGIVLDNLSEGSHKLEVDGLAEYTTIGQGLHRFQDPVDGEVYMYTQFETADAKRVFCCFDQPDIKARYDFSVTTPEKWRLVTNNTVTTSDAEGVEGAVTHTATVDYQLSTYLVAFCVGPWHEVRDEWSGTISTHEGEEELAKVAAEKGLVTSGEMTVPLGIYCRQSLAEHLDADELFEVTKQGFTWYAENFGVGYPFYKYDQVFCPEYNMGAMENAGCVTIRDEYVFRSAASHYQYERRADTILHELAHMWFGDLVTMEWWDDLWLNESFATWSAAMSQSEATKYNTAWVTFGNKEKAWAYNQDQLSSTHPVFSNAQDIVEVDANFDGITYAKGASVLKQLAAYVGLENFLAAIRSHFVNHAWGNATFDDLLGALNQTKCPPPADWAEKWLKTTGINTLKAEFAVEDGKFTSFDILQTGAEPGAGEKRTHRVGVGIFRVENSGTDEAKVERVHGVEVDIDGERTTVEDLIGGEAGQLVLVNDQDLTYAMIELDEQSLQVATENITAIDDPMVRSLIWSATWQMTRNAQMRARDFVSLVARGATSETEMAVLEQILAQARSAVNNYADPSWAGQGWATLREAFAKALKETSGQAQLAFARAFAGCVHSAASAKLLRGLLGETEEDAATIAPGLDVDQDLRWLMSIALTASARSTGESPAQLEKRISAEEKADGSAAGELLAVQARAAVPTAETKSEVWQDIVQHGSERSNVWLRHSVAGLTTVGHDDLLIPFSAKYIKAAPSLWTSLSHELALRTLGGLYPDWDHSDSTDQAIAELVEAADTPDGLRRTLKEGRDRVARSTAARTRDAQGD